MPICNIWLFDDSNIVSAIAFVIGLIYLVCLVCFTIIVFTIVFYASVFSVLLRMFLVCFCVVLLFLSAVFCPFICLSCSCMGHVAWIKLIDWLILICSTCWARFSHFNLQCTLLTVETFFQWLETDTVYPFPVTGKKLFLMYYMYDFYDKQINK